MDSKKLQAIHELIKSYKTIIIFPHQRPDGDAMGTAFGLKHMIEASFQDKTVYVVGESSEFTSFIGVPDVLEEDNIFADALGILVDTANIDRMGDERFKLCEKTIKIDHHIKVETYGDVEYIDTSRPAAALIVLDLYNMFKEDYILTKAAADALFFGILTDTGRFKYSGVNGDTFRNVAMLYDSGLDAGEVYDYLDTRTENFTRFKGFVLQNYEKTENGVVYFKILPKYLEEFDVNLEEATSLVNELGKFKDCPIWALFAEYEEGIVRCRLRSKGPAINELAGKYDGGGHAMASGASLGTWERTELILKDADQLAKSYKEGL
ncbi:MAG: bifunctional oligoribonuclease/PAP phosphatase NrnA [Candidatus Izimaplasma sp.]|nr:bifunctional oligoribonuclease/PAP phosphatase NrnA [Candidatus Izimaplasma bacterium]